MPTDFAVQLHEARSVTVQRRGLAKHLPLFTLLEPANMSADETDGPEKKHPSVFRIIIASWQSQELRNFLWALDAMYREDWARPRTSRRTPGNEPRVRVLPPIGTPQEHGVAPIGLPRNCYDRKWLSSLTPHARRELEVQDLDYDFSF
ncbi:hypothetical protein C8Q79DRAFT_913717 [Trametes meyenii]|nr:hypothetical protein C8Q79DRAFT_913717 [Trametes meyenii]